MNYISEVEVLGFWGTKNVKIEFQNDLNFLIGPNGSGKTTIINLIASVLKADIPTLYSVQFDKISIRMNTLGSNRKPLIEVEKIIDEEMGNIELHYSLKQKASGQASKYVVEGPYDERLYKDSRLSRSRRLREDGAMLSNILTGFAEVNWLSIHRTTTDHYRRTSRDDVFENSIDQKLSEISKQFSNYFSLLNSKADLESKNFQEHTFLSLLNQEHTGAEVFSQVTMEPEDKETVVGVLTDLGVSNRLASKSVADHFSRLENAKQQYQKENILHIEDAVTLSDARRVRQMIIKWRELQHKLEKIFAPRDQFEEIINNLFSGKELHFNERNLPKVHLKSGEEVNIGVLSSGEKQLFILLGEALLQEERPVVFISDEPELSLHVTWQNSLFENIRNLNSASQIISATHSPDIVGSFQNRVINIEDCIIDVH